MKKGLFSSSYDRARAQWNAAMDILGKAEDKTKRADISALLMRALKRTDPSPKALRSLESDLRTKDGRDLFKSVTSAMTRKEKKPGSIFPFAKR